MLNYLSTPGASDMMTSSMPMAIPGAPMPSTTGMAAPVGAPPAPPPIAPGVSAPSGPITQSMMPPAPPPDPSQVQYIPVTQQDGSILLHISNPDGTPGPAVKIIPAPKQPKAPGQP